MTNTAKKIEAAQHTPGPWFENVGCIFSADDTPIATAGDSVNEASARDIANARLIAAAPDLLEALERLLVRIEPFLPDEGGEGTDVPYAIERARVAIAQARGQA